MTSVRTEEAVVSELALAINESLESIRRLNKEERDNLIKGCHLASKLEIYISLFVFVFNKCMNVHSCM